MIIRILLEGISDVPTVREVLVRGLGQVQGSDFQLIWHRGKGRLPIDPNASASIRDQTLLGLLPAKLRAYAKADSGDPVVVLLDADRDDWKVLRHNLLVMLGSIAPRPKQVLFRIAVEELESWFIADVAAVKAAYPNVDAAILTAIPVDTVVGAWEKLAQALGFDPKLCSGADKETWAQDISPHLILSNPPSPTFKAFIKGLETLTGLKAT